ncbi:MAG: nuclear transport factor 2 family protein [bacterium]
MSSCADLLAADRRRRKAMIEVDINVLEGLLDDKLLWTHSSGKTESKSEVIAALAHGSVTYESLDITQDRVLHRHDSFVHQGELHGRAVRDGITKQLKARFTAVWHTDDEQLRLVAWQSTNCS